MPAPASPLAGSYDFALVTLSVVIAVMASGAALDLAGRITAAQGRNRMIWLFGGGVAMGLGIWSMHYTGMLAFNLPVPVRYHVPTVALSLIAAIVASQAALFVASRDRLTPGRAAAGSLAMGAGIATMHYTGMMAMRLPATTRYNPAIVALSILIAVGVSAIALWLAFRHGHAGSDVWTWGKVGSALVMGAAIPGMHYAGMAAARFIPSGEPVDTALSVSISALGAGAIGCGTLVLLLAAIGTSIMDRRFSAMHRVAREGRDLLRAVVEGSGEAIFAKDLDGRYIMVNSITASLLGRPADQMIGRTDAELFEAAVAYRIQAVDRKIIADGKVQVREETFDHPSGRQTRLVSQGPLRDSTGRIFGTVGAARDITDRKRAEAQQASLVAELQSALAEVKTLRGLVTVCSTCRRVLTDAGSWQQIESYVRQNTEAEFSHGICPECARTWEQSALP